MRHRKLAVLGGSAVLAVATAGAALGAVTPAPTVAANGNAGYGARTADPAGFTDNQALVNPDQYATTVKLGANGAQLCNTTSNFAAQIGETSNNLTTVFSVQSAVGTLPAPGCPSGGTLPGGVTFPGLSAVPYGHHVWVNESLVKKAKTVRILICVFPGEDQQMYNDMPAPAESPVALAAWHGHRGGPGKVHVRCHWAVKTFTRNVILFEAQDLNAPAVTTPGDLPGVQARYVHVPAATVLDAAALGVNENATALTACAGIAADGNTYPRVLPGPAGYTSDACQPVTQFSYGTASVAGGPAQDYNALNPNEGISPAAAGALVAPSNSLRLTVPADGPAGTASDASTAGSFFTVSTANAPTA